MSYIFDRIDYFPCLVRREFTTNFKRGKGEYLDAIAIGMRCHRGLSLYFQVWFQKGDAAGAMFLLPIHALCTKPCELPPNEIVQPWDVFSPTFSVSRIDLLYQSRAYLLPRRDPGRYLMTVDFMGTDLADDLEQHKHLHVIAADAGFIAAVPNNRVLVEDLAFLDDGVGKKRPDFDSLAPTFTTEGMQCRSPIA